MTLKNFKVKSLKVQKRKRKLSKKKNKNHTDMHFNKNSRIKRQWSNISE